MAVGFRLPLAIGALVSAAIAIALSAVLMSGANGSIYMLQLDTTGVPEKVRQYVEPLVLAVSPGEPDPQVLFPSQSLQSVFFNDSANSGSFLVERYLNGSLPATYPPNTLWDPRRPDDPTYGTFISFAIYSTGNNISDGQPIVPTQDQSNAARQLGMNISGDANSWAVRDRSLLDSSTHFRLRIAGLALLGLGFIGLIVVAAARGKMPGLVLGLVAGALGLSAVCLLVSAAILTKGLIALQGTYVPFGAVPSAFVTYNLSAAFLALSWVSAGMALVSTIMAAAIAALSGPKEPAPMLSYPEKEKEEEEEQYYVQNHRPSVFGHQSISQPYEHSANADETAKAKAHESVGYAPSSIDEESSSHEHDAEVSKHTNRYSAVSSLGPSPVRTRF